MNEKILRFLNNLPKEEGDVKIDAAIIYSSVNRFYLTGFKSSDGIVIITKNNAYLIVDFRYYEIARRTVENFKVVLSNDFRSAIMDIIKKENLSGILLEFEKLTFSVAKNFESIINECGANAIISSTLDDVLSSMRIIKTKKEVGKIKVAQQIAEAAFDFVLPRIRPGLREKDVALDLEFFMRRNGASSSAFDIIVVSGKNSSLPHGEPSNKVIEEGEFVVIDIGAVYKGYSSDMTRTIAISGINDRQKEVYDTVLKAQNAALDLLKPEAKCSDIDKVARDIIYGAGFKDCFGHSLGHGVGLEVHEGPSLSPKSKEILKAGMVVTVEPGIYIKDDFGVRIEDMVLIEDSGYMNFTHIKKDLIII